MKILAVDTATESCSVAIVENERLLTELTQNHGLTHTIRLMPMIDAVLADCRTSIDDMDGLAVTIGPGSFTGLRIGLSTIKGLALAVSKPIAGVSALDALARQFSFAACRICTMIDARKNEVYEAEYEWDHDRLRRLCAARVVQPREVLTSIADVKAPCLFVGNGALLYKRLISEALGQRALFAPDGQMEIRAGTVGMIARHMFKTRLETPISNLVPLYIRRSDAEIHASVNPRGVESL